MLAANQGLLYVLSMVVIGGLVGGGGLGYDVVAGFSQGELFGKGLAAGIAIVLLGIMLDRIAQYAAARYGPVTQQRCTGPHPRTDAELGTGRHEHGDGRTDARPRLRRRRRGRGASRSPRAAAGATSSDDGQRPAAVTAASSTSPSTRGSATRPTRTSSAYVAENELGCTVELQGPQGGGRLAGLRHRRGRRRHRELGPRRPEQEVHRRAGDGRATPARPATRHHRLVRAASGWPRSTRTSPTGRTSTSTPTCSRPRSPAARASCSTATRRSSPTTRRSSKNLDLDYKVVFAGSEARADPGLPEGRRRTRRR